MWDPLFKEQPGLGMLRVVVQVPGWLCRGFFDSSGPGAAGDKPGRPSLGEHQDRSGCCRNPEPHRVWFKPGNAGSAHRNNIFCFRGVLGALLWLWPVPFPHLDPHKKHRRADDTLLPRGAGQWHSLQPEAEPAQVQHSDVHLPPWGQAWDPLRSRSHYLWVRGGDPDSAAVQPPQIQVRCPEHFCLLFVCDFLRDHLHGIWRLQIPCVYTLKSP